VDSEPLSIEGLLFLETVSSQVCSQDHLLSLQSNRRGQPTETSEETGQ
jgi:hypothetical protein